MRWTTRPRLIDVIHMRRALRRRALLRQVMLRRAALRYCAYGWPVTPGAWLSGGRFTCDRAACPTVGCHPALERWQDAATTEPQWMCRWWSTAPYAVLLATGHAFDVLEVPAPLGRRVLGLIRLHSRMHGLHAHRPVGGPRSTAAGPVAATPAGRWMFLVKPGDPVRQELSGRWDVVRHGTGSWIPAPPTRLPEGGVRWEVPPEDVDRALPDSLTVQALLVEALAMGDPGMPVADDPAAPARWSGTRSLSGFVCPTP